MAVRRLFAVDLGASGGKCFAASFDGLAFSMEEVHRFAHEGVSFHLPDRTGRVTERTVWDDVLIHQNILRGLQAYRRGVSDQLDSVGVDTWGADGQFFSPDGEWLGHVYCYRDHRLDGMIEVIQSRMDARRVYEITGNHFQPFNMTNQLHWFVRNRAELLQPGCFFLPVPSVFYYYLGGVRMVDSTWASVSQLMDAKSRTWSGEILEALDIPAGVMPPIVAPGAVVGELTAPLAAGLGLNRARLVAVASHDTASAFAAAPVTHPDECLIVSSGTWSLVGKFIPAPLTTPEAMAANMSNEGGIGNIRFLKNCMGTWLVQELRRIWRVADGREADWDELNRLTAAAPALERFIDPDDPGFYNPENMEAAIAAFCRRTGQAAPADRGQYLRAVYESLALKYRRVNEQICRICGTRTRQVNIVGGGCRNALLNQFVADALNLPVMTGPEEATAVGNFMVQALGLGILGSLAESQDVIRRAFSIREYRPGDRARWEPAYARFLEICGE